MKPLSALTPFPLLIFSILMSAPVTAHDYTQGEVSIDHPWSRPTPPGTPVGVGYMVITNGSDSDIVLVAAESPRAGKVSIHETTMEEGMMRMQPLTGGLAIPAGETVELKPRSYHLMLESLTERLREGESVPLTLEFEGVGTIPVELTVESLDAGEEKGMEKSTEGHQHH